MCSNEEVVDEVSGAGLIKWEDDKAIVEDLAGRVKAIIASSNKPVHLNLSWIAYMYGVGLLRARRIAIAVSHKLSQEGYRVVYTYLGGRWGRFVYPRVQG